MDILAFFHVDNARELAWVGVGFLALLADLLAGLLIDHLHAEAYLATVVEAQELDLHFLAFLQNRFNGTGLLA